MVMQRDIPKAVKRLRQAATGRPLKTLRQTAYSLLIGPLFCIA
jgi:hypothetical protein